MIGRGSLIACLLLGLVASAPALQDEETELDKLLRVAVHGKAPVRPQAARRIVRLFARSAEAERAAIVARLLDEAGTDSADLAALGSALVEVLGELDDARLRGRLWAAVEDADFPWRPYAARGLAVEAREPEHARFLALLDDPIAPVRGAAIGALEQLDARDDADVVRRRLSDEVDLVRRAAADLLVRWGHEDALWYLMEELSRDDRFFDRPTGREARYKTERLLKAHLGDLGEYDADLAPAENAAALAALGAAIEARAGERPDLPPVARALRDPQSGEAIGLELRSCRRGEYFLRWTTDDRLLVGQGSPAVLDLPAGTTAGLIQAGEGHTAAVETRSFGAPGCDLELLHWRPPGATTEMWIVSKGPQAITDLRPAPLGEFFATLLAGLPDDGHEDPRVDHLRSRALEALAAIGGPIE